MKLHTTLDGRTPHPLAMARKHRGLSLRALAESAEMSYVAISHVETGRTQPLRATKRVLAETVGYEVKDIWPPEGKKPHPDLRPGSNGHRSIKKKARP